MSLDKDKLLALATAAVQGDTDKSAAVQNLLSKQTALSTANADVATATAELAAKTAAQEGNIAAIKTFVDAWDPDGDTPDAPPAPVVPDPNAGATTTVAPIAVDPATAGTLVPAQS